CCRRRAPRRNGCRAPASVVPLFRVTEPNHLGQKLLCPSPSRRPKETASSDEPSGGLHATAERPRSAASGWFGPALGRRPLRSDDRSIAWPKWQHPPGRVASCLGPRLAVLLLAMCAGLAVLLLALGADPAVLLLPLATGLALLLRFGLSPLDRWTGREHPHANHDRRADGNERPNHDTPLCEAGPPVRQGPRHCAPQA